MKTSRQGIFETNSSSVHAIVIDRHPYTDNPQSLGISFSGDNTEFGWESDTYNDTYSKLQYLISCINDVYWGGGDNREKRTKLKKKFEGLMSELGVECVEYGTGGVDHGYDAINFVEFVLQDLDTFKRYLFSSKSYVVTGNDNDECSVFDIIDQEKNNPDVDIFEKGN